MESLKSEEAKEQVESPELIVEELSKIIDDTERSLDEAGTNLRQAREFINGVLVTPGDKKEAEDNPDRFKPELRV
jgi:hypothetical protein